jgi:putative transposase
MSRAAPPSGGRPCGVAAVCRTWRVARATVRRRRAPARPAPPRRRGPAGPMPDADLVEEIRRVPHRSPFHGEGHRKAWARLRIAGVRTSRRRVLRPMRENGLLAPSRAGSPRGPRAHDGTIVPDAVDAMWGADPTTTVTGRGRAAVFVAVDHHSAGCVGLHAALRATRLEALGPLRQGVRRHFGASAKGIAGGLALRHDHGSRYMADDFRRELRFLGVEGSPAFVRAPEGNGRAERFVRAPEGNGRAERFIRTPKENLSWVRAFDAVEDLRAALLDFRGTHNTTWLIERHGFRPPAAVRNERLQPTALAA